MAYVQHRPADLTWRYPRRWPKYLSRGPRWGTIPQTGPAYDLPITDGFKTSDMGDGLGLFAELGDEVSDMWAFGKAAAYIGAGLGIGYLAGYLYRELKTA